MKNCYAFVLLLLISFSTKASDKDSTIYYNLQDSVKAVQYMAEINVLSINSKKEMFAGIQTNAVKLSLESDKHVKSVVLEFDKSAGISASGLNTDVNEKGEIEWKYSWNVNENYKLLIVTASDSAQNFSLYSGYIWLPKENKWKFIGTCKISGRWNTIQQPSVFYTNNKKANIKINIGQVWCQRQNGSWKNMKEETLPNPTINL